MGGGAAMRAAAKVAGFSVVNAGLRGAPSLPQAELPVALAARKATRPASLIIPSSEEVKSGTLTASQNNLIDAGVQRPCWELGEWEFAGREEEQIVRSSEPLPRLVFGGVPTLEETKEATIELKGALEKVYLSSAHSTGCEDSCQSGFLLLPNPEYPDNKACITYETEAKSAPNSAIKAFRFLNENPGAQTVVASIATDPNVWHAVLQNDALVQFLESQKSNASFSDMDPVVEDSDQSPKIVESSDSVKSGDSGNGFVEYLQSLKTTVVDMMSTLSDYFQNLFSGSTAEKVRTEADAAPNFIDGAVLSSFMGLAVMVIMVVVLKRV